VLEKKPNNFYISRRRRCYMQWGLLLSVLGCRVGAVLEKELSNFNTQLLMQWRPIEAVSGRRIGAMLEKEPSNSHTQLLKM